MIKKMNAAGLSALLKDSPAEDIVLLDVREVREFDLGHLEGAVNIPMSIFESGFVRLPRDRHIVVICLIGHRSVSAAKLLEAGGYSRVSCLKGGMLAWNRYVKKINNKPIT